MVSLLARPIGCVARGFERTVFMSSVRSRSQRSVARRAAFTLIELLVVIAIIALLISILLPALSKARQAGQLAVSLTNVKQIQLAAELYARDNKAGTIPPPLSVRVVPQPSVYGVPWGQLGNYAHVDWATANGGQFDFHPVNRVMNPYIYPDTIFAPFRLGVTQAEREQSQLPFFKAPGDKFTTWTGTSNDVPVNYARSLYADVGTSYENNFIWMQDFYFRTYQVDMGSEQRHDRRLAIVNAGLRLMSTGQIASSKFVTFADAISTAVITDTANYTGQYGGRNKSVMAFLDGHGEYVELIRKGARINNGEGSMIQKDYRYSFVFDSIKPTVQNVGN
jgi:prepilin-type N-terminal cleavage/methylation domain-containing protein